MTYKHEQTGETPDIAAPGALWNSWRDWGKLKIWYRTAADWRKAGELMQCAFVEGHWLGLRKYADGTASTTRLVVLAHEKCLMVGYISSCRLPARTDSIAMKFSLAFSAFVAVVHAAGLRPEVHFTPRHGFMNDPNGLFFDDKRSIYHYYYQCELQPFSLVHGSG